MFTKISNYYYFQVTAQTNSLSAKAEDALPPVSSVMETMTAETTVMKQTVRYMSIIFDLCVCLHIL